MFRKQLISGGSALALVMGFAGQALAQGGNTVEEVVVTGSFIQGTPEDAALPVDVISADELEKKGAPTTVEMIKALTVSNGVVGESNQFAAAGRGQADEGRASVNLRGLGPELTLVLLNGKRVAFSDLNTLPQSAIGRVEVLKDGAAATYGSDAIGGVVNFITRRPSNGLDLSADYRVVPGSDGQYNLGVVFGRAWDHADLLLSAGYQHKTDLPTTERDWAVRPFHENPDGGWSGAASPTRFTPVGATFAPVGAARVDVGCTPLGGIVTADGICRNQYITWDNIVEEETRYQLYAEANFELTDTLKAHVEALYAHTDTPTVNTTPSYATSRAIPETVLPAGFSSIASYMTPAPDVPNGSNFFYVPRTNPGFTAYCASNPTECPAGTAGAIIQIGQWRPFFLGGNPLLGGGGSYFKREREQLRVSGGVSGQTPEFGILGAVNWDANLSFSQYKADRGGFDALTGRLELALRGLGGAGCDPATGTPGVGACKWFNPFSNGISGNPNLGLVNPGYNSAVANTDKDLIAWFFQPGDRSHQTTRLWEGNLIFNGKSTLTLPGGEIGYAAGVQWRRNYFRSAPEALSSTAATPCAMTPINGSTNCTPKPTSPFVFLGTINPVETERDIYAGFVELNLPVFDNFNIALAARYEDYGKFGGETFNPKLSARWQVTDAFALRGSVGSTFRAPPQTSLIPDAGVSLQNIFGTFRPVETSGNPNLTPEKAVTYSVGAILNVGRFRATLDYWDFKLEDILTTEPLQSVLNVAFPTAASTASCSDPFVTQHFTFSSAACSAASIATVKLGWINGPETRTSGLDLLAQFDFDTLGGNLEFGGSVSYITKYEVAALVINGVTFSSALDAVGYANFGNSLAYPLPQWKSEAYAEFSRDIHNLRWTVRYIDAYEDQRTTNFRVTTANTQVTPAPTVDVNTLTLAGKKIDAQIQHDLAYRVSLPGDLTVSLAIQNVFNADPSFARTELSYDPLTGNPLGRTYQMSLRKRF